jgi:hypothetical protein
MELHDKKAQLRYSSCGGGVLAAAAEQGAAMRSEEVTREAVELRHQPHMERRQSRANNETLKAFFSKGLQFSFIRNTVKRLLIFSSSTTIYHLTNRERKPVLF